MPAKATAKRQPEIQTARLTLRRKGWSQAAAAPVLGITREHLNCVLTSRRQSRRILAAIQELPENPKPA